ncbi:uncharacterized protein LOC122069180 isoform X2 [Macadamia integrifolia]|uniref:uncharacterized protein LOC122069180 isoform X2 n=1 Tax=Macadamia integrifolia TaxID=60698 RepID=UPI001C4EAEA9|nr:uncharacterized protein LOC122069180 isoform X2 [Macadamia integrifolia]
MGNEMGNQNVSRMQEQDSTKLEASKESVEVSVASINANCVEDANQQVFTPKEDFHEYNTGFASGDSSRTGDPKQTINGGEQDKTEAQAPEGSLIVPIGSNNHNGMGDGMQLVSSIDDEKFHQQTGSPSKENFPTTMDNQIQIQASSATEGEETRTVSLDTKSMICPPRTMELETIKSEKHESSIPHTELSVSSSEDQKTNEHTSSSEDNSRRTNESQTQSQASIGGEGEETGSPSLDSTSMVPNPQSVESETFTNQHKSTIFHAESSVPSLETGNSNEHTGSASEDNSTSTNDNQVKKQASIGGEWEEARTSSLDTKSRVHNPDSMVVENLKSHHQESTEVHTEVFVEASSKSVGSSGDVLISSRPQDSEEKGQRLVDDITHILGESYISHSYTEVEIMGEDVPMENMESQDKKVGVISNINEMKSDIINGIEVGRPINGIEFENRVNEEQESTLLNALGSHVVLSNNRIMKENGSESEQKRYDSNTTFLSDGLVEESNANEINICQSEFVAVGSDHEEERKGSELCDSYKPIIQSGLQIDDENVPLYMFKLNMQDSNQSLVSEISCKEHEGETKMVVMDIIPTESILTDSNHEEGKLPTFSSSSMDPTKNKFIIGAMEKTEDPDLIGKYQEEWGTQLHPIEPVENFLRPNPVSLDKSQVPKQDTLIGTDRVGSRNGSTIVSDQNSCDQVDVRKTSNFDSTNSTVETMVAVENEKSGQDLSQHLGLDQSYYQEFSTVALVPSGMSTDGSQGQESTCDLTNNEMNQDNIKGKVDLGHKSSLELYTPRKESEAQESRSEKKFFEKGLVSSFENCVFDTKETSSIAEVELHAEISKLPNLDFEFPPEATPIPSPEKTAKVEEFKVLEIQLEDINFHVEVSKPTSFDFELPIEERIEESGQSPILCQESAAKDAGTELYEEMSAEKHVITLGRTSSEKLTPLLDFLKEGEKNENESGKKNKGPMANKSATSSRVREKSKPKYSLFCNCMGCTEVIQ